VLRREMSTEMVLQLVWSSTRAVLDVASFTIPMYPTHRPPHCQYNHSHKPYNKQAYKSSRFTDLTSLNCYKTVPVVLMLYNTVQDHT